MFTVQAAGGAGMSREQWAAVDAYLVEKLVAHDPALLAALEESALAGLPPIAVSPMQGKLLHLYVRLLRATRVLEIGTLGGYSTIWMARGLAPGGRIITLEYEPTHAEVARRNFQRAGVSDIIDVRVGRAIDSLPKLQQEADDPFDLVFVDADKASIPEYFEWSLKLTAPGSVIIVDNVIRDGAIIDLESTDPNIIGIRRFNEMVAAESRVSATAIQTVGLKGYDGFAFLLVG